MLFPFLFGLNFFLYLICLGSWLILNQEKTLNITFLVFNFVSSLILMISCGEKIKIFLLSSKIRKVVITTLNHGLLLILLGLVNYLAFQRSIYFSFDQTQELQAQTKKTLDRLDGPLEILVFARKEKASLYRHLFEKFRAYNAQVELKVIDPDYSPEKVKKHHIIRPEVIKLSYQGRSGKVFLADEEMVTAELIRLMRTKDPILYLTQGHGGPKAGQTDGDGLSLLKKRLEKLHFVVQEVQLFELETIPSSIEGLIILGPEKGFLPQENRLISDYLKREGRLFLGLGPQFQEDRFKELRKIISDYGMQIENSLVVDTASHVSGSRGIIPIAKKVNNDHLITKEINGPVFFPLSSPILKLKEAENLISLAWSSAFPQSWSDNNLKKLEVISYDSDQDRKGPLSLAMALLDEKSSKAKMIVVGNGTFVTNQYINHGGNFRFFMNSLSWLLGQEGTIMAEAKSSQGRPVILSDLQLGVTFYSSVVLGPLFLMIVAAVFYYQRRKVL